MARFSFPRLSADEAAAMIPETATVGFSGYAAAGAAKAVPRSLSARLRSLCEQGRRINVTVLSADGDAARVAPDGPVADGELGSAAGGSAGQRFPQLNTQSSQFPYMMELGLLGGLDFAVVEAIDVLRDGRVYLTSSAGPSPTLLRHASQIVIEINQRHSHRLQEMHDAPPLPNRSFRLHLPIERALDRIGAPYTVIEPHKVVGIIETDEAEARPPYAAGDDGSRRIAEHIARFLSQELRAGRIPPEFLPMQFGGGSLVNAVAGQLGEFLPRFDVYGDVLSDSLIKLMESGRLRGASATSLALSAEQLARVEENMDFFSPRIVLRPQVVSNDAVVLHRLGVVSVNQVAQVDLLGRASFVPRGGAGPCGCASADFVQNAYLSFLITPSVNLSGALSTIVPMVDNIDQCRHTVDILVTEQGLADLRGLDRLERALAIVTHCAHPRYRRYLYDFARSMPDHHAPGDLVRNFELQRNFVETGVMLPVEAEA